MNTYKYRIYHDEAHCSNVDRTHSLLTAEQLEHEYDSIDTAFHLYSRAKNVSVSYDSARSQEGGVDIAVRGFNSEEEADRFVREFPAWLKNKLGSSHFCPVVTKAPVLGDVAR